LWILQPAVAICSNLNFPTVKKIILLASLLFGLLSFSAHAQPDEDQLGAWYMYFWSAQIKEGPFGFQGDYQFRNWNIGGDLEQLLLRTGATYTPKNTSLKLTLGYAHITTGAFGDSKSTITENRIYQEALLPQKVGGRIYLLHRFRFEQRWVDDQDFRTRWRYNIFVNVPLNKPDLSQGAVYLAFYNELFMNGQQDIGDGRSVEFFDRNRTYGALGYSISPKVRTQLGYMQQSTNNWSKGQLQVSLHHSF